MKYKVLYRKYRPDDFENIIGQEYIIKTLQNSIINQNISHAYIFSGPRGTGKTSTAKVFSKAINCLENKAGSPCGKCEFCTNFVENPDIIEIDAASNNGVDEIRNLIDNIKLTPTNGKYKVYIIDEVHMLTTSAFNALLLTLEEPPKHAVFILATTNIESVPITILSRCQRFDFQKIKVADLVSRLKKIAEIENISIDEEALNEVAYLSEGGMRDALSLLDQLAKNSKEITLELVEKQIKIVSQKTINDLFQHIENNEIDLFLDMINEFRNRAIDYKILIKKLIENASLKAKNIKISGKYNRLDFDKYKDMVLNLSTSLSKININVDPYTILEMLLLEYFDISNTLKENSNNVEPADEVVNEKNSISQEKDTQVKSNEFIDIRINNCFVNAQKKYLEEFRQIIANYTTSSSISGKIKSIILDSNVVAASDKFIIFTCDNENSAESANKHLEEIEKSLEKYIDKELKVIFISSTKWDEEKKKYIENIKNNVKYKYIEEKKEEIEENSLICDVFDISKVEII